jgi:4-hydroxy-tetrahydrodipicolinate synthase
VAGNIVPKDVAAVPTAFQAGDLAEARRLHLKLFPLYRDMLGLAPNPVPVKAALAMLGRGNGELRLPMTPLDARGREALRRTLVRYGLAPRGD